MFAINAHSRNVSLIHKVSHGKSWYGLIVLSALIGCRAASSKISSLAPQSTVVAQAVGSQAVQDSWLNDVTISYANRVSPNASADEIALTRYSADAQKSGLLKVLAVRYPHPDGHKDRARVELVIADPSQATSKTSWYGRIGKTLNDTLPGMAWGDGIVQAKAIDLPLGDLQQLLTESNTTTTSVDVAVKNNLPIHLSSSVNGRSNVVQPSSLPWLDELAQRVDQEGKLITYRGSAKELQQQLEQAPQVKLVENSSESQSERVALIPLPPVDVR